MTTPTTKYPPPVTNPTTLPKITVIPNDAPIVTIPWTPATPPQRPPAPGK